MSEKEKLREIEQKAWMALQKGHYKSFGKWAHMWKLLNSLADNSQEDPFINLHKAAKEVRV